MKVEVEVRRDGGFGGQPVRLRYSSDYFDLFDENAFTPQPDAETAGSGYTEDQFGPPGGEVFVMSVDTRIEPACQRGEHGQVTVMDDAGRPVLTADFSTFIWP